MVVVEGENDEEEDDDDDSTSHPQQYQHHQRLPLSPQKPLSFCPFVSSCCCSCVFKRGKNILYNIYYRR
jgi:hypothetical protein